jgi:hypothetical protein
MKSLLSIVFASLLLYSCDSIDEQSVVIEDNLEEYSFKKIEYLFTDGSEKSLSNMNLPTMTYSNGTSLMQTINVNPLEGIVETSQFATNDTNGFTLLTDSTLVSVPFYINESNNISLGGKKRLYSYNIEKQKPNFNTSSSFQIQPYQKLTIKPKLVLQRYSVKYILTLEEKNTAKEVWIEGQWIGVYLTNAIIDTEFSDL